MFPSVGPNGSQAVPNGHRGTTRHGQAQAGRQQKIGCPGPGAILGRVNNPSIKPN